MNYTYDHFEKMTSATSQYCPYIHFILSTQIFVVLKTSKTHETKIPSTCDLLFGMRIPLGTLALNHRHRKQLEMRKITKNSTEKGTTLTSVVLAIDTADSSHTS